ncbi:hypothetical protein E8E13_006899 [Curvularia kusanoi]|uniref:Uncharacterized protein n=1 Tax=Curvularia kusanoi TaxID=90978 RepID=A0A9P4TPN6_CURKU|nr:hypothetical protein E8E13_006899 [Curvularia kusanoi]
MPTSFERSEEGREAPEYYDGASDPQEKLKGPTIKAQTNVNPIMEAYTMAPWARRNELSRTVPSSATSRPTEGPAHIASSSSVQALMHQLFACHNMIRQQQQRIYEVEEELRESRKREEAGQEVFLQLFSENQKLCAKSRDLETERRRLERVAKDGDTVDEKKEIGEINPFAVGLTQKRFRDKDLSRWNLNKADQSKITALRYKHEYYKGWFDAMVSVHDEGTFKELIKANVDIHERPTVLDYMYNARKPKGPFNAGLNVGLLFGWSALCNLHNLPEHDVRLDGRRWELKDLLSRVGLSGMYEKQEFYKFWDGLATATEKIEKLFALKLESGVWNHREDPAQIRHMRPTIVSNGIRKQQEQARAARREDDDPGMKWVEAWHKQKREDVKYESEDNEEKEER